MNTANKNGILFGLLCPGALRTKKEPVAYLYGPNKVRLPLLPSPPWMEKFPEWGYETHPYVYIWRVIKNAYIGSGYFLTFSRNPVVVYTYRPGTQYESFDWTNHDGHKVTFKTGFPDAIPGTVWDFTGYSSDNIDRGGDVGTIIESNGEQVVEFIWANHDVINEDDRSTYLAKSDPIPVYE